MSIAEFASGALGGAGLAVMFVGTGPVAAMVGTAAFMAGLLGALAAGRGDSK